MNASRFLAIACLCATLPVAALAQTNTNATANSYAQFAGMRELTLGAAGASNREMNDSFGALDFSYGMFMSPTAEWLLRQSVDYTNPRNADSSWNGSTRLAFDYHLATDVMTRPFLGANVGYVYGDTVHDSWTAGLEAGAKVFIKPQTFLYAMASYDWRFDRGNQIDDRFNSGRYGWSVGLGYDF
ncbi:MAG TPA: hypothetical protein VL200_07165 [Lacunisphaera sp.]|jgi:hypothetical protein|nr:hypothetical protein [Lacunisphaera sp.]